MCSRGLRKLFDSGTNLVCFNNIPCFSRHDVNTYERYRRNRWTDPSSLLRGSKTPTMLHSLASRGTPKMRDPFTVFLPGLGNVRLKEGIPKGEPGSFQMIDCTRKVTCRTADADRRFALHAQLKVPDPKPATGN